MQFFRKKKLQFDEELQESIKEGNLIGLKNILSNKNADAEFEQILHSLKSEELKKFVNNILEKSSFGSVKPGTLKYSEGRNILCCPHDKIKKVFFELEHPVYMKTDIVSTLIEIDQRQYNLEATLLYETQNNRNDGMLHCYLRVQPFIFIEDAVKEKNPMGIIQGIPKKHWQNWKKNLMLHIGNESQIQEVPFFLGEGNANEDMLHLQGELVKGNDFFEHFKILVEEYSAVFNHVVKSFGKTINTQLDFSQLMTRKKDRFGTIGLPYRVLWSAVAKKTSVIRSSQRKIQESISKRSEYENNFNNVEDYRISVEGYDLSQMGGNENLRKQLEELISMSKNSEYFESYGISFPTGILLHGAPGTGKTLAAKILASQMDVNFYNVKASDLNHSKVGDSEKAIRCLFKNVKTPCIIFIDEIESIARNRSDDQASSGHRNVVLGQLLQEIDGLSTRKDITIVGATNLKYMIDEALLRGGRLSQHIFMPRPDLAARKEIFDIHKNKIQKSSQHSIFEDLNYELLAEKSKGLVGADIEVVLQNVVRYMVHKNLKVKGMGVSVSTRDIIRFIKSYINAHQREEKEVEIQKGLIGFWSEK